MLLRTPCFNYLTTLYTWIHAAFALMPKRCFGSHIPENTRKLADVIAHSALPKNIRYKKVTTDTRRAYFQDSSRKRRSTVNRMGLICMDAWRRIAASVGALLLIFTFASCGGMPEFDPHELASILATADLFHDPVHAVEDNLARMLYGLDGKSLALAAYAGSGMTPEAVLVAECNSDQDAPPIAALIADYNARQVKVFESFNSDYRYEAEEALIEVRGKYVIYVACKDSDKAAALMEKYFESLK